MRSLRLSLLLLLSVVLLLSQVCSGAFRVITPVLPGEDDAGGANAGFEHQLALFGRFDTMGHDLVAPLVLAPLTNRRACDAFNRTEMPQVLEQSGVLKLTSSMNNSRLDESESAGFTMASEGIDGDDTPAFVLMVERGDCHFVEKVRHAQEALAAGVVIYNGEEEDDKAAALPTMADDGTSGDIRIPSLLIHHKDALKLMRVMETAQTTVVLINWEVPNPDNRLDVALWFSSRSSPALHSFIKTFANVLRAFNDEDVDEGVSKAAATRVQFTPYYDVFDGSSWGCLGKGKIEAEREEAPGSSHCEKLCVYDNKFCTYDPERDSTVGLDGKDVLEEDIRQLCITQYAQQMNKTVLFLDYLAAFNSKCSPLDATINEFNGDCSRLVQASLDIPSDEIAFCISEQGESLLSNQIKAKYKFGVVSVPQFSVNDVPFHGLLSCDEPISFSTCAPLKTMCTGFEGTPLTPKACSEAFWGDSCFAPLEHDDCGDCNLREDAVLWNRKCAGCDGIAHSGKNLDECGICGGTGSFDICGRCLPQEDTTRDKSCLDCKGVPNGFAKRDVCGVCDGRGSFDACGLCLDAHDPRRQNSHCRVIEDPDAVKGKAQITGIRSNQLRGAMLDSFQQAISAAANVNPKDVLLKSVDDTVCNDKGDDQNDCVEVFFFIPCGNNECRKATAKRLQDPSASLTVAMKMRTHLNEVAYGLDEAATIEHVHLHSISTMSTGIFNNAMTTEDAAASETAVNQNELSWSISWAIVLGALCLAVLLVGFVALKARDDRIQRDFQQMFAVYTPLTSLDQEDERENGSFA